MRERLLEEFLREEATDFVKRKVQEALSDNRVPIKTVETDRFEIIIDHDRDVVTIEDILDTCAGPAKVDAE